jgi:NAD(P)-dependent dehydrogenase (short-subunit alcohol dehydrogenase family)
MNVLDSLLDLSIVRSFDRSGFERHRRLFDPDDLQLDLSGKIFLVTGANSGLGQAASTALARLGAAFVDVADQQSIGDFVHGWSSKPVDGLIHNAGVLSTVSRPTRRPSDPRSS